MAQTPFTFPAQYAQFRKVRAEQERSKENTDDYASARHVGAYRDNMSILHMALVNAGGEEWAKHFTDNIEDVYDVGYHEANIDNALKMKAKGYAVKDIAEITGLTAEEIEGL